MVPVCCTQPDPCPGTDDEFAELVAFVDAELGPLHELARHILHVRRDHPRVARHSPVEAFGVLLVDVRGSDCDVEVETALDEEVDEEEVDEFEKAEISGMRKKLMDRRTVFLSVQKSIMAILERE